MPESGEIPQDVVCARIALNTVLVHFGNNELVNCCLRLLDEKKITSLEAVHFAMEIHEVLATRTARGLSHICDRYYAIAKRCQEVNNG